MGSATTAERDGRRVDARARAGYLLIPDAARPAAGDGGRRERGGRAGRRRHADGFDLRRVPQRGERILFNVVITQREAR